MSLLEPRVWEGRVFLGEWVDGGGAPFTAKSPATGEELARVGLGVAADVATATEKAAAAQPCWAELSFDKRAAILRRAGDILTENVDEICRWAARETGSIRYKAQFETETASQECMEAAALAAHPYGNLVRSLQPRLSFTRRVPVGVVGVIAPFNAPIILAIRAIAPALAVGNAVILKPDPRTAVTGGVVLARAFEEAGVPPGIFSCIAGGADVGEAIVIDPAVKVIAFTGSTGAGRAVATLAGQHLKRAHLELGGNNPLVVLDDVDVDKAVSVAAFGSYFHQGQICMATGRHIVDAKIADAYVAKLAEHAGRIRMGDPVSPDVMLGPIIDVKQRDHIHGLVTSSVEAGARLVTGGTYNGLFYRPTVLADVTPQTPAYREEVFGPVAPVIAFNSLDEAVALASDSEYGLAMAVLGGDVDRALAVAGRIPSGTVHINDQTINDEAQVPFGGVKDSGAGSRAGSPEANLEAFTETQWVTVRGSLPAYPF